jgi:WD repeat-containing protein 76
MSEGSNYFRNSCHHLLKQKPSIIVSLLLLPLQTPKPFATHAFAGSINSSFFSPSGSYLLTTSTADVLTLTKDAHLQKGDMNDGSQVIKHDNRTGRYLATFMARWHGRHDIFTVGSMKKPRQLEVFSLDGKGFKCTGKIKGDAVSAVCSRNCFHDTMPVLVGGSSSGRIVVAGMD